MTRFNPLSSESTHRSYRNPQFVSRKEVWRCICGADSFSLAEWQQHAIDEAVKDILIDHARVPVEGILNTDDLPINQCRACGILPFGMSFAGHTLDMLRKNGFIVSRMITDGT